MANSNKMQLAHSGRGDSRVEYDGRSIDRMIYEFMERENIPGLTLSIVQAPYIPRVVGYGQTNLVTGQLSTPKTLWAAADISQGYCAVAVMQLYEQGRVKLDAPVGEYIDNLPVEAWRGVTLLQLLRQTSGIPDYRQAKGYDPSKRYTFDSLIEMATSVKTAEGDEARLSATNFLLLTEVVERMSGISYSDFVKRYQIDFLDLKQTFFADDLPTLPREKLSAPSYKHSEFTRQSKYIDPTEQAAGYVLDSSRELIEAKPFTGSAVKGFADIWASATDISLWDIALAGSILVDKSENRDVLYTSSGNDSVPAMSGWHFYRHKGLMDIRGTVGGFSSYLSRFTDSSELVCVTLMANRAGVDFTHLARSIAAAFDNEKMGNGIDDNLFYSRESQFDVGQTTSRLKEILERRGIPVFAVYDHAANARGVGMSMRPTSVVVFGSPSVGTKLMLKNQVIASELPLKVTIMEDEQGSIWLFYPRMDVLAAKYGLADDVVVRAMEHLLEELVAEAASVY